MRILWHSNSPLVPTGYGCQVATFAPRFQAAGHQVAVSAFYPNGGAQVEWNGITVFPGDDYPQGRFGRHLIRPYLELFAGEEEALVLTLMDVWALGGKGLEELNVACWTPVDHQPVPPRVGTFFYQTGAHPIAMSRFGQAELQAAGLPAMYVPHGIDTAVFRPMPEWKREIREALGIPDGVFVYGMVANNQGDNPPRKAHAQVMQVFKELHQERPDTLLWLHCDMFGKRHGVNLVALAELLGIPDSAVMSTDATKVHLGLPAHQMAQLYNAFDVLVNPSYGEGFGIPLVEAQACGIPVIATDWTSMSELCGAGWLIDGDPWYDHTQGAFFKCPSLSELFEAMTAAYDEAGSLAGKAREFALAYEADRVMADHWRPVLEAVGRGVELPRIVEHRQSNRATKRARVRVAAR